jgi:hypothetical protein
VSRPFEVRPLETNSVAELQELWAEIDFDPSYQRQADIWERSKRQLFIDSLLNGYDIPKLYFHEFSRTGLEPLPRFAIIDGKQRLEAIREFIDGKFSLSDEFEDIEEEDSELSSRAAGISYRELALRFPDLKVRFDDAKLPVMLVQTPGDTDLDHEIIEEMFSRLNEAVPLNAPEKRNALGGPLPPQIRRLAKHVFFESRLAYPNSRFRHLDLATKFLYMEHVGGIADLKKRDLDKFVLEFRRDERYEVAEHLTARCNDVLQPMEEKFVQADYLLGSVGMVTLYFHMFRVARDEDWLDRITRAILLEFDEARAQNRARVKEAQALAIMGENPDVVGPIDPVLAQFERYAQSPNDAGALSARYAVLEAFVKLGHVSPT